MKPYRDENGRLTYYGLACGYGDEYEKDGKRVTLFSYHGVIDVKAYDHDKMERIAWESFSARWKAYKFFNKLKSSF